MRPPSPVVLLGVLLVSGVLTGPAAAAFKDGTPTASLPVSSSSLAGPASLTATGGCDGVLGGKASLSWAETSSTFATGYAVWRRVGVNPFAQVALVSGRTSTAFTDTGLAVATTYDYQVRAVFAQWTGSSPTASATTPLLCL